MRNRNCSGRLVSVVFAAAAVALLASPDVFAQRGTRKPASAKLAPSESAARITVPIKGGHSLDLVRIDPGTFTMGSTTKPDEGPARTVALSRSFYMATTEVPQDLWIAVMGRNPSQYEGAKLPVERVTWTEANDFVQRLSSLTGRRFRLPTEAEWEYACLGASAGPFGFGDDPTKLGSHAWFEGNAKAMTHPVGTLAANAWGISDMHGNVWEWCSDWYSERPDAGGATDPKGPPSGTNRVLKGGSYGAAVGSCRCANRFSFDPNERFVASGVRVVMESDR